eukprot:15454782-Alexandrium_andersonii.AAC.1
MERLRRRLQGEAASGTSRLPGTPFSPAHPWGAVIQRAASPTNIETMAFWNREVINKALFFVAQ